MRNRFVALLVVAAGMALYSTEASAWVCRAGSPTGSWGKGWHTTSLAYAKQRALLECAVRTPRRFRCYITGCI